MASIGAAVRNAIIGSSSLTVLGNRVYRDLAPDAAPMPFVTFIEPLGDTMELRGDGKALYRMEIVQVTLWQQVATEDLTLVKNLKSVLDGATLGTADVKVLRCRLWDAKRVPEDLQKVVAQILTLRVTYQP